MATLGDSFPKEIKESNAVNAIKKGTVIKCFMKNTIPEKEKRFIVLGKDCNNNYIGVVFINSKLNFNINYNEELRALQFFIKKYDNDYLDKDSYVDCSQLIELDYISVKAIITENPARILGKVKRVDIDHVCDLVRSSPKIEPIKLEMFGLT
ncbi:MAG: hypothetical protein LBG17_02235 [Bacteroidales bacterium]|jgi:hypothetical protein|nr:hypothetical protein [Bacteroidales bacterium]